jgi:uncharacterized protein (TIRG00374 family)
MLAFLTFVEGTNIAILLHLSFLGMMVSSVILWVPDHAVDFLPSDWEQRFVQMTDGWRMLSRDFALVGELVGLQIIATFVSAGRFWIAFQALSQDVTYAECLLFASATVLTRLVNIAPGGLGVREGIVAGVASLLGFEAGISAVAVGIDRLVATSMIIVLGTIYTYILSKKATDAESDARLSLEK